MKFGEKLKDTEKGKINRMNFAGRMAAGNTEGQKQTVN